MRVLYRWLHVWHFWRDRRALRRAIRAREGW